MFGLLHSLRAAWRRSLLAKQESFRVFFLADTLGKVADSYFLLLLPFLLEDLTSSGLALGLALGSNGLARGVLSLYGGVLADRYQPQRVLAWHNGLQGVALLILYGVLVSVGITTAGVYVLAIVFGVLDGLSAPASQAAATKIVEERDLLEANSYLQGLEQLTAIVGPVGAGLLLSQVGLEVTVVGGVVLYILSTLGFGYIYRRDLVGAQDELTTESLGRQVWLGLVEVRRNMTVRASLLLLVLNNLFITGPAVIGLLLLFRNRLGYGADVYAYAGVVFSIGFVVGVPLVQWLTKRVAPSRVLLAVYIGYALTLSIIGWAPSLGWVLVAYGLVGPMVAIDVAITTTWQQLAVPRRLTGRVGALAAIAALALDPLSQALTGAASDWSIAGVFYIAGWGLLIGFLGLYMSVPSLRNITLSKDDTETEKPKLAKS